MRRLAMLCAMGLALAACATSEPEPLTIAQIDVEADLTSMQNPSAVQYWQNLSSDLEAALATEFSGQIDPGGKTVTVDVDELSLSSLYAPGASFADARLSGRVTLLNPNETVVSAYDVTATSGDVVPYLPEGTVTVPPTSSAYYAAVVRAFARGAAETLRAGPAS
ncbi:MAG TPA: hypothetical protein PKA33_19095 [Amaricoccus sp.]|uniref:hypothetical protein n=1 Tax=Amaricoccus sp. TaxID=1872485 RepID=UPI002D1B54B0|nr:hypothetical protein [Amaricoccus sp.]HMQ93559.1 hypothetical protein [Amaricoccus sp.]HMR54453.1 hypothetical protein [Amaricoccus sp.]HMR60959.1 hypothetical protein [Amaricoccus sp.]HMU01448.1 hypothetical protein [Amaricoccus sp.]